MFSYAGTFSYEDAVLDSGGGMPIIQQAVPSELFTVSARWNHDS